jgi:hypothetical protein
MNDDNITDALWDVDEEEIEERLRDEECFHTSLPKALVSLKCFNGNAQDLTSAINACMNAIERIQRELGEKVAQRKDDARRFQCDMRDDDWDDYKMRMTA